MIIIERKGNEKRRFYCSIGWRKTHQAVARSDSKKLEQQKKKATGESGENSPRSNSQV